MWWPSKYITAVLVSLLFLVSPFVDSHTSASANPLFRELSFDYIVNGQIHTLEIRYPTKVETKSSCATLPVTVSTPSSSIRSEVDLQAFVVFVGDPLAETLYFSMAKNTWNVKSATSTQSLRVCNLDSSKGVTNQLEIGFMVVSNKGGGLEFVDSIKDDLQIIGTAPISQIRCVKGTKSIIIKSSNPSCPTGFTRSNTPSVNGQLKKTTITCVKGLSLKKVTAISPSCPAGYRRQ